LRPGNLAVQVGIGLLGIPLGIVAYLLLEPAPLIDDLAWRHVLGPALVFLLAVGLIEELIFRGLLQTVAERLLGWRGLVFTSVIFAGLHVGYHSSIHLALVLATGLLFAWLVARTGSILGTTLAHGLLNIALYLVLPVLALQSASPPDVSQDRGAVEVNVARSPVDGRLAIAQPGLGAVRAWAERRVLPQQGGAP
jgi:membrane protease YdiL (CAAX protease family)